MQNIRKFLFIIELVIIHKKSFKYLSWKQAYINVNKFANEVIKKDAI